MVLPLALLLSCDPAPPGDGGLADGGVADAGLADGGVADGGLADGGLEDGGGEGGPWAEELDGGLRLRCGELQLQVDLHEGGRARLRYQGPGDPAPPAWAVGEPPPRSSSVVTIGAELARIEDARLAVAVDRDCRLTVTDDLGRVLVEDGPTGGWSLDASMDPGAGPQVLLRRQSPEGEWLSGLGGRTGGLDRRGRRIELWNTDAYDGAYGGFAPDADPLYLSVPLLLSIREGVATGILTDSSWRQVYDLAATDPELLAQELWAGPVDQWVLAGPDLSAVMDSYTDLTGRPFRPPRWSLGYHQCRWGYWPDSRLDELAAEFRGRGLPADALWLDIQHHDGFRSFTWDPTGFPDPAGLAERLAAQGFHLVVIADPGIKVDPGWAVYDGLVGGGHALTWPDGTVFEGQAWAGTSAWPDLGRAETRAWWATQVGGLVPLGVDGLWLDLNEPTTFPEGGGGTTIDEAVRVEADGRLTTMAEAHNLYALWEARASVEGLRLAAPDRRPFVLSRAGFAGTQRYAAVWTGDGPSSWSTLKGALPMLLGMGLSGIPMVGSDVGGYSGGPSAELFARWMALGVVSPFFRGHVTQGSPDQEPWAFGTEVEDISRELMRWRYRMIPTWESLFDQAVRSGAPPLRPLAWRWPDDPTALAIDDQALLGDHLMVAPVLEEGADTRQIYLPEGRWFELESGAVFEGPAWITQDLRLAALPRLVAEGGILVLGGEGASTGELSRDPLDLDLYPGALPSRFTLYEDAGEGFAWETGDIRRTLFELQREATGARLSATVEGDFDPGERTLRLRLRRVDHAPNAVSLDGRALSPIGCAEVDAGVEGWCWDEADLALRAAFLDPGDFELEADYDPTLISPDRPVPVTLRVRLPEGTPNADTIHVATDAGAWTMVPLTWLDASTAEGVVQVPRGHWFEYKYSRGDWCTVEKWPSCEEAENRYGFGAAWPLRQDQVWGWRDWCEGC